MAFFEENNGGSLPQEPKKPDENMTSNPSDSADSVNPINSTPVSEPVPEPDSAPATDFLADSQPEPQQSQPPVQQPYYIPQQQPQGPKDHKDSGKKLSKGSKIFISVIAVITCLVMIGSAIGIAGALNGNNAGNSTVSTPIDNTGSTVSSPNVTLDTLITRESENNLSVEEAYDKVVQSVVGIKTYVLSSIEVYAEGTGMIISEDGYILTCYHVVEDCNSITVTTNDGSTYEATIAAYDANTDIAVLKINATGLTPVEFGSSDDTGVGQFVLAVGNPGGEQLSSSLTFGVLSGKQRESSLAGYNTLLQFDAAVNPGNSGGPLCNLSGQVIGLVSSKIADIDYEGIGFAIPSDEVLPIVQNLLENGYVTGRVRLGITVSQYEDYIVTANNLPGSVYVVEVAAGTDAAAQGIREGDIITAVDGEAITSTSQMVSIIRSHEAGDKIKISIFRKQGGLTDTLTLTVTLYEDKGQ
ncbi:MAG TPA: trypsin-like peptidase domain-containing protein [Oscillospiraceae bacterium]|nr:trypsin-like peptidase domain-containing protein [Oscillospiraceae bacterium]HPF54992.1 trypsin-like peptidase domain-containing protein [Clostridiales bacterium]HPK34405.1 trypsin-like peptidase domain-containing protein [Oscillospiraceae bacterium]HPR76511.1 trypsin-like peptidase domain-containing protein [Oscillospiraceae bacterium]